RVEVAAGEDGVAVVRLPPPGVEVAVPVGLDLHAAVVGLGAEPVAAGLVGLAPRIPEVAAVRGPPDRRQLVPQRLEIDGVHLLSLVSRLPAVTLPWSGCGSRGPRLPVRRRRIRRRRA